MFAVTGVCIRWYHPAADRMCLFCPPVVYLFLGSDLLSGILWSLSPRPVAVREVARYLLAGPVTPLLSHSLVPSPPQVSVKLLYLSFGIYILNGVYIMSYLFTQGNL